MLLSHILKSIETFGNVQSVAYLLAATFSGVLFGVIPGIGGIVILSAVLAFISHISLTGTLCIFLGLQAASYYSASITSILLNTPAHPEAFAVTLDGFPMAQRGEAGRALGISAASTCIGGFIGCLVLIGFIQMIDSLPGLFKPPELVALIFLAMLLVGTLGTDQVSKSIVSTGIGIVLASFGSSPVTGIERFTFGTVGLYPGLALVAVVLGIFAIPQMMLIYGSGTTIARQDLLGNEIAVDAGVALERDFRKQTWSGLRDVARHWIVLVIGGIVGVVCGVIPGIGGFAANFLSYGVAQQVSPKRSAFGTGVPEGVISAEASSLAKEAGGLVPIIGLGIPGSVGGALFIAALSFKGVRLGYGFAQRTPVLAYEMVWVIALAGFVGTLFGLILAPWLARVTRVPGPLLVPFVMVFALVGPYISTNSYFAVVETMVAGMVGFILRRLRFSLAAFVIGLVLGPTLEDNLFLTHQIYPGWSFIGRSPFADVIFIVALAVLGLKAVQFRSAGKRSSSSNLQESRAPRPYPVLGLLTSVALISVLAWIVAFALVSYPTTTAMFPVLGACIALVALIWRLPFQIMGFKHQQSVRHRSIPRLADTGVTNPGSLPSREFAHLSGGPEHIHDVVVAPGGGHIDLGDALPGSPVEDIAKEQAKGNPHIVPNSWGAKGQYTRELLAFLSFALLVLAVYVFGLLVAIPIYGLLFGLIATKRVFHRPWSYLTYSAFTAIVLWALTYFLLKGLHVSLTPIVKF